MHQKSHAIVNLAEEFQEIPEKMATEGELAAEFDELKANTLSHHSLTLIAHSSSHYIFSDRPSTIGGLTVKQLAKRLASLYGNNKDKLTEFYLLSCEAGLWYKGHKPLAYKLAKELEKVGFKDVNVYAFSNPLNFDARGGTSVGFINNNGLTITAETYNDRKIRAVGQKMQNNEKNNRTIYSGLKGKELKLAKRIAEEHIEMGHNVYNAGRTFVAPMAISNYRSRINVPGNVFKANRPPIKTHWFERKICYHAREYALQTDPPFDLPEVRNLFNHIEKQMFLLPPEKSEQEKRDIISELLVATYDTLRQMEARENLRGLSEDPPDCNCSLSLEKAFSAIEKLSTYLNDAHHSKIQFTKSEDFKAIEQELCARKIIIHKQIVSQILSLREQLSSSGINPQESPLDFLDDDVEFELQFNMMDIEQRRLNRALECLSRFKNNLNQINDNLAIPMELIKTIHQPTTLPELRNSTKMTVLILHLSQTKSFKSLISYLNTLHPKKGRTERNEKVAALVDFIQAYDGVNDIEDINEALEERDELKPKHQSSSRFNLFSKQKNTSSSERRSPSHESTGTKRNP